MFGTKAPDVKLRVSREKRTITRQDSYGMLVRLISFNEAKAALAAEGKVFESDAKLAKALWDESEGWQFVARLILKSGKPAYSIRQRINSKAARSSSSTAISTARLASCNNRLASRRASCDCLTELAIPFSISFDKRGI